MRMQPIVRAALQRAQPWVPHSVAAQEGLLPTSLPVWEARKPRRQSRQRCRGAAIPATPCRPPPGSYHGAEAPASSGPGSDATCTLIARPEQSAKSFSYVPVRKRQVEAAEQAARAEQVTTHQLPPQAHIKYESISQFSQKVELYRGRWALAHRDWVQRERWHSVEVLAFRAGEPETANLVGGAVAPVGSALVALNPHPPPTPPPQHLHRPQGRVRRDGRQGDHQGLPQVQDAPKALPQAAARALMHARAQGCATRARARAHARVSPGVALSSGWQAGAAGEQTCLSNELSWPNAAACFAGICLHAAHTGARPCPRIKDGFAA